MKKFTKLLIVLLISILTLATCGCDKDVTEYTGVVTDANEIKVLDKYKNLSKVDFSGSTCYELIEQYISTHPQIDVTYQIKIGSQWVNPDVKKLSMSSVEEVDDLISVLSYLSSLNSVDLSGNALTLENIKKIKDVQDSISLSYSIDILGKNYDSYANEIDLSSLKSDDVEDVLSKLSFMLNLNDIIFNQDDEITKVSLDDFYRIKSKYPNINYRFSFDILGNTITQDTESLNIKRVKKYGDTLLGNEAIDTFRKMLFCFDNFKRLEIIDESIDDELLSQLRDEFPEKEVVWQVDIGWVHVMSDATSIWAIGGLDDEQLSYLKYCTNMEYMDLGHNGFTDIGFVSNMPNLKALIVAKSFVRDLTPLASCKQLEYLEIASSGVDDISPLAECVNLQHLNLSELYCVKDISPLYNLKNLKRVFGLFDPNIPQEQIDKLRELNPDSEIDFGYDVDMLAGRWRRKDGVVNEYYLKLVEIFGYPGVAAY